MIKWFLFDDKSAKMQQNNVFKKNSKKLSQIQKANFNKKLS